MKLLKSVAVCLICGVFCTAKSFAQADEVNNVSQPESSTTASSNEAKQNFYTFRRDLRRCVPPLCGGLFVKAVNQSLTRCADGQLRGECYVAGIVNSKRINTALAALLKGRIVPKAYAGSGIMGALELASAFRPTMPKLRKGLFVGLKNNGLMCITSPCFSYDEQVLNVNILRKISRVDLDKTDASEQLYNQALAILARGEVLIASGYNKKTQDFTGPGLAFVANQFYFPIQARLR